MGFTADPGDNGIYPPTDVAQAEATMSKVRSETVAGLTKLVDELSHRLMTERIALAERTEERARKSIEDAEKLTEAFKKQSQTILDDIRAMGALAVELGAQSMDMITRGRAAAEILAAPAPPKTTTGDNVAQIASTLIKQVGSIAKVAIVKDPSLAGKISNTLDAIAGAAEELGGDGPAETPTSAAGASADTEERWTLIDLQAAIAKLGGEEGAWWKRFTEERQLSGLASLSLQDIRAILAAAGQVG